MSEEQYNPVVESAAIDADELMAKYDKESAYRRLTGFPSKLVFFLCVAWSVFQLYKGLFGTFLDAPASTALGSCDDLGLSALSYLGKVDQADQSYSRL